MDYVALTPEQKRQFYDEGYLIVRNALDSDTVARLVEAGDRLCASDRLENRQRNADGLFDGFRNVVALDRAFEPLLTWHATVPLIAQLFGPRIHLATSHLIYKHPDPPGTPATKRCPGWHRDIMHTPEDLGHAFIPRMEMKCAYYLTDLSEPNSGATLLAPGSNHAKERLKINPETGDPANMLEPSLKPGDAVFFENRTWHAGGANLCGRTRKAVMFGYSFRWVKPMDYVVQPPALVERMDPIGRQLLGATADPEGRFVAGGGADPLLRWCENHRVAYVPVA
ncbi:MAG: phytanoyl-CoA dioxygenase family protein [Planctomycetota bacterium]|nr:phytanoyl-CoA dioxygenase family protein [Planctomycetota bacterium]